ncbi:hypothetical protein AB0M44_31325 [Streptosporangium subroseum]|uniref:hypothetical protein n=1 Tax=Streptosporangium subroseum TaxID=106412 RepID=UPI003438B4A1
MTSIYGTAGVVGLATTGLGSPDSSVPTGSAVIGAEVGPASARGRSSTTRYDLRTSRALRRRSPLTPASLLDQLVTARVRSLRDLS